MVTTILENSVMGNFMEKEFINGKMGVLMTVNS